MACNDFKPNFEVGNTLAQLGDSRNGVDHSRAGAWSRKNGIVASGAGNVEKRRPYEEKPIVPSWGLL
jgi:hypothetical protein